ATTVAVVQAHNAGKAGQQARSRQLAAEARLLAPADVAGALRSPIEATTHCTILAGHNGTVDTLAFHPDGHQLAAAGSQGDILVWDTTAPKESPFRLTGHSRPVTTIAFSPDGRFLVSGGREYTAILWDTTSRTRWAVLTGHTDTVLSATWSPDGTTLYTGAVDKTIIPWTIDTTTAALTSLCNRLTHDFPPDNPELHLILLRLRLSDYHRTQLPVLGSRTFRSAGSTPAVPDEADPHPHTS
ncbi:MAG: WD40 repeat domain-containing protein, partial [Gammaproteobacteria bacterium]